MYCLKPDLAVKLLHFGWLVQPQRPEQMKHGARFNLRGVLENPVNRSSHSVRLQPDKLMRALPAMHIPEPQPIDQPFPGIGIRLTHDLR